jgi:hypothetical protein
VPSAFFYAVRDLGEEAFQSLYGRWDPLPPASVAELFGSNSVRWYVAGGRAARIGAPARHHEDIDVVVRSDDLDELRRVLAAWDLWEANSGWLRPLLPGVGPAEDCEQLWARLDAGHPWQMDLLLDRSGAQWTFKRDSTVQLPWDRAVHIVDGIPYLRPEIALLYKARLDRPKDREDLLAAALTPDGRAWLAATLERLGHDAWAQLVRISAVPAAG